MTTSEIKVQHADKLPTVHIVEHNLRDAHIIQNDYASVDSETTAIMTYTYQSYIVRPFDEDIANILMKIAMVEMRHHKALGNLIVDLGGDPIIGGQGRFWTGRSVCYARGLKEMLYCDIEAEEKAIEGYKRSIELIQTEGIDTLLNAIIEDEQTHILAFKEILEYITFWK